MSDVALRFGAKDDGLNAQFTKTGKDLDALRSKTQKASDDISGHFKKITAAAAVLGLAKIVGNAVEFADQLQKASDRTGIAAEGIQRLQFAAGQAGVEFGTVTSAISRMQNQLALVGEGSATATAALTRLRIPVNDFIALNPEQQFNRVAVSIAGMESPTERAAAAIGIFGKGGAELLPVLVSTGKELDKVQAQLDAIGGPVSNEAIARVDALGDSFGALKLATTSLATELLALGSPAIIGVFESVQHFFGGLRVLSGGGDDKVVKIIRQIEGLKAVIEGIRQSSGFGLAESLGLDLSPEDLRAINRLNAEIDGLLFKQQQLLSLDPSPLLKIAPLDESLIKAPSFVDPNFVSDSDKRLSALNADNNPVVIAKLEEKDLLLKINQETNDSLLQQETALSVARLNLNENTQTTLLGMAEAFSGQIINWARFRADFEQNSTLATVGLVGEALSASFSKNKAFQIAMATVSTIAGVTRALADYPYPYSLIIGGAVALSGAAQIAKIRSTNVNGGSSSFSSSVGSGAGSAPSTSSASPISAPPTQKERGIAQIHIHGDIMGEQSLRWLVDRLRETIGDFDLVLDRPGR